MLIAGLAELVATPWRGQRTSWTRACSSDSPLEPAWETRADDLVRRSRTVLEQASTGGALSALLTEADDVADGLEEAAFLLTLAPQQRTTRKGLDALRDLSDLITRGAQGMSRPWSVPRRPIARAAVTKSKSFSSRWTR